MDIYNISNQKVRDLAFLIRDYLEEEKLTQMVKSWKKYDDPDSDPGLQYEQEMAIDKAYKAIKKQCENI